MSQLITSAEAVTEQWLTQRLKDKGVVLLHRRTGLPID